MAGTLKRLAGPLALTNTYTTNLYNQSSALLLSNVKQLHFVNKTAAAATVRIYLGATGANAAGTELFYDFVIPANDTYDWYTNLLLTSADFLVGGASANTTITLTIMGELMAA
jgi:hypothetical protein